MGSRRTLLIMCIVISAALFIDGILLLGITTDRKRERFYNSYDISRVEVPAPKSENPKYEPVNAIILGLDGEEVRTDVILLLNFNPANSKLNILSIARDTRVDFQGKKTKINALIGRGGENAVAEKVEEITGLPIQYYLTINFKGFRKIVDTLGGIVFDVPINMKYDDPEQDLHINLRKGRQLLNGEKAEQLVRYRKGNKPGTGYEDGDLGRIEMQQEFLKALIKQKLKLKYLSKADKVFSIFKSNIRTNIEIEDINYFLDSFSKINYKEIKSFMLPGESTYTNKIWYYIYDKDKTREIVEKNFSR